MKVAIHQPDYFPYPGYFSRILECDYFVFLDDVQYSNNGYTNWNRIKSPQGELRLKVPVKQTYGDLICDVTTKDELKWKEKHLKSIFLNYKKAEYFDQIYHDLEYLLKKHYSTIAEMNMEMIRFIVGKLEFSTMLVTASSLGINSKKEQRVIDICKRLGADTYISGHGAKTYQTKEHFVMSGIELKYTEYHPLVYPQLWGDFIENLSILDYLFQCGYHWPEEEKGQVMK